MRKIISLFIVLCISLMATSCASTPSLSPMQIKQITTKIIDGSYEDVYRATLTVLQDLRMYY